jgi:predicted transcriptional regulator
MQLTDEDWNIIDARIEAARRGEIATDEEVAAVLGKYRPA